ncbi:hypothetical protein B1813_03390 [Saccharomonospora piscinae]|uniref:DUF3558 domain-containing protein n=1 Tax=Saccharomonospora piscinae TaxID=687388 RepID=A0A1V9A9K4_SACPI|nr:hypothetical protein B1813_03390 [Saccharomonospora piscinae]
MLKKQSGLIAAVAAVTLTASCATSEDQQSDTTDTPSSAAQPPLTAEAALGDLAAVDFCALLDPRTIEEAEGTIDFERPGFSHCLVGVDTPDATMTLTVGNLYDESQQTVWPTEDEELSRGLHRQSIDSEIGCLRALVFGDDIGLTIAARELEGAEQGEPEATCRIADAATDGVQSAALSDEVFTHSFQPGSLAEIEPCSLLDDADAADVLGDGVAAQEAVGGHGCTWPAMTDASAELSFDVALQPDLTDFADEIAGRPTMTATLGDFGCEVSTPHIAFSADDPNEREVVAVSVTASETDACAAASELAGLVWPELPESP